HATQAIENIRTVVSLSLEEHFIQLYEEAFDRDFRSRMLYLHYIAFANALANSLMFFSKKLFLQKKNVLFIF
ncbi:unnamed protein product, partial [Rotaria sp. Silwood2]